MSTGKQMEFVDGGNTLEVYATELHTVDHVGPCVRMVFCLPTIKARTGRQVLQGVVCVVVPLAHVGSMIELLARSKRAFVAEHSEFVDDESSAALN